MGKNAAMKNVNSGSHLSLITMPLNAGEQESADLYSQPKNFLKVCSKASFRLLASEHFPNILL